MSENTVGYYDRTAFEYDQLHGGDNDLPHIRALERSWQLVNQFNKISILDVGCGTGRSLEWFQRRDQDVRLIGIDPSNELLSRAKEKLPCAEFFHGRGEKLPFADDSIDLVLATGVLHHADRPRKIIAEMFRVARDTIIISDHNLYAFGSGRKRRLRGWLSASGLLPAISFIAHGFCRQGYSQGDGWYYPYSLLDDYEVISNLSSEIFILPTCPGRSPALGTFTLDQTHLAIVARKGLARGARASTRV